MRWMVHVESPGWKGEQVHRLLCRADEEVRECSQAKTGRLRESQAESPCYRAAEVTPEVSFMERKGPLKWAAVAVVTLYSVVAGSLIKVHPSPAIKACSLPHLHTLPHLPTSVSQFSIFLFPPSFLFSLLLLLSHLTWSVIDIKLTKQKKSGP